MVVDPSLKEEAARGGLLTVIMNTHQEVCAVQKADGIGLSIPQACPHTFNTIIVFTTKRPPPFQSCCWPYINVYMYISDTIVASM